MKIYQTLLFAILLLLLADSCTHSNTQQSRKERHIGLAFELEFEQTHDLKTKTIPTERLFAAKVFADQKRRQKSVANLQWEERGPNNVGGRTRTLIYDLNDPNGNTVFAGSVGGGLWQTTNINAQPVNWQPIDDFWSNIAISTIAQNPANPNEIYVGTGEGWFNGSAIEGNGIWKTNDGGKTWNQLLNTKGISYINKIVVADDHVILAAVRELDPSKGGVFRSEDGGNTWLPALTKLGNSIAGDLEIAANGDIYASMGVGYSDGIYKSTDNGVTWDEVYSSKKNERRIELACAPSNPEVIYALIENDDDGGIPLIKKTNTGGVLWQDLNTPLWYDQNCSILEKDWTRGQDWFDLIAMVDPFDENVVYIGGVDLFKTTDSGDSWTQISHWYTNSFCDFPSERVVHADQHAMAFKPGSNSELLFGHDGGVSQTLNASTPNPEDITFLFKSDNYNVTQFYATAISNEESSTRFLAGAQDNGTQYYRTAGINSTREVTGGDGAFCHIDEDEPNIQISSYVYNNYRITNDDWRSITFLNLGEQGKFINPTDYDSKSNTLYAAHDNGKFLYIKNVGTTNNTGIKEIEGMEGQITAVTVSPNVPNRVYFSTFRGELMRVDNIHIDFQTTVTPLGKDLPFGYITSIAVERGNDDHLLLSYSNYGGTSVWESKNGGTNWVKVDGDLPDMPVRWIEFNPNNNNSAVAATELGVWMTDALDGANTIWNPSNNGLANVRVNMLQFRPSDNFLVAATMGRGLFSTSSFNVAEEAKADLVCASQGEINIEDNQISIQNLSVQNVGNADAESDFEVAFYLSRDNNFSSNDILIATEMLNGLAVNSIQDLSLEFDIDLSSLGSVSTAYYVGYRIDESNQVQESNEANNSCYWETPRFAGISACTNVVAINCDTIINDINGGGLSYFDYEGYDCLFRNTPNYGGSDKIYEITFETNTDITIQLKNLTGNLDLFVLDGCSPDAECLRKTRREGTLEETVKMYNLLGTYYIVVDAPNEDTNASYTLDVSCKPTAQGKPNLRVRVKGDLTVGGASIFVENMSIQNNGEGFAEPSRGGYYLSLDTIITTDDYLVTPVLTKELPAGLSYTSGLSGSFRENELADGDYYFGILLDENNTLDETNELDNYCHWAEPIIRVGEGNLDLPNLICDNLGWLSLTKNFLSVFNFSVKNIGVLKSEPCHVGFYLSMDKTIDEEDIYLGETAVRALNPNAKSLEFFSERLTDIPLGEYYVGMMVDYKEELTESNKVDNFYFYSQKYIVTGNDANVQNLGRLGNTRGAHTEFILSPNPSQGQFQLHLQSTDNDKLMIDIINSEGRVVRKYNYIAVNKNILSFDLSELESGLYYVRFTSKETVVSKKLLLMQ